MHPEDCELKAKDSSLEAVLMLEDRIVKELVRLGQLAIDEPCQVRSGVTTIRGAVQSRTENMVINEADQRHT